MRRLLILTMGLTWTGAWADDLVEAVDAAGKKVTLRGKIEEESSKALVIKTSKGSETVPSHRVTSVKYDAQPPKLLLIDASIQNEQYEEALKDLKAVFDGLGDKSTGLRAKVAFSGVFCQAMLALQDESKAPDALDQLEKFGKAFPDSLHHYKAVELVGKLCILQGDYEKAARAFDQLKQTGAAGAADKANVYKGISLLRQGQHADALKRFEEVLASTSADPESVEQRNLALAYKGESLIASGQHQQAEKHLRDLFQQKKIPPDAVTAQAIARNALGDALLGLKREPKEVLVDGYLWVICVFEHASDQLPRALFQAANLFDQLNQKEEALQLRQRLRDEFPNNSWTKKLSG